MGLTGHRLQKKRAVGHSLGDPAALAADLRHPGIDMREDMSFGGARPLARFDTARIRFRSRLARMSHRGSACTEVVFVSARCTRTEVLSAPLGLYYLVAQLRRACPEVSVAVLDLDALKLSDREAVERIAAMDPRLVGFTSTTMSWSSTCELAEALRERLPDVPFAVGGSHVSARDVAVHEHQQFDYIVRGEGEPIIADIVRHLEAGRPERTVVFEPPYEADIDMLPAHDLCDFALYPGLNPRGLKPAAMVTWSRGCPFNCTFCANSVWIPAPKRVRYRSCESIVEEMRWLKRLGVRELAVYDDEINTNVGWLAEVLEAILKADIGLRWKCLARTSIAQMSPELLRMMKRAGCWSILWGIESGRDHVL